MENSSIYGLAKQTQIMNAFFKSQFSYSPLTCMMHNRKRNNKMNWLYERCLRVTYDDSLSSYNELLERNIRVSVHNRNIHSSH